MHTLIHTLGLGLGAVGWTGLVLSGFTENTTRLVYGSATLVARKQQSHFATFPININWIFVSPVRPADVASSRVKLAVRARARTASFTLLEATSAGRTGDTKIQFIFIGNVAKWLCCFLATSVALPYTRRVVFSVNPESTRPVQPTAPRPSPKVWIKVCIYCIGSAKANWKRTSPRFQSMWLLLSARVCELVCPGPH